VGAIALHERPDDILRCAICHDEPLPLERCVSCRSAFHADCRESLGRCPTLGCVRRIVIAGRRLFPWGRALAVSFVTGTATALVFAYLLRGLARESFDGVPGDDADVELALVGFAALLAVHALVMPAAWAYRTSRAGSVLSVAFLTVFSEFFFGCLATFGLLLVGAAVGTPLVTAVLGFALLVGIPVIASHSVLRAEDGPGVAR
jgi:hypothetical protein